MLLKSLKFKPQIQLAGGDWIWGAPSLTFIFLKVQDKSGGR